MSGKHTPGPWTIERKKKYRAHISGFGWHGLAKVIVRMRDDEDDCEDGLANARLIASAPDLLEALEDLFGQTYASTLEDPSVMDRARAAIAKAKGEA